MNRIRSGVGMVLAIAAMAVDAVAGGTEKFRLLESHPRDGYTLETWEFYPDDPLAVKTLVLVPDGAKTGGTPAVICLAPERGSVEFLAGEADPYGTTGIDRGRRALFAVKAGYVAMALARPGEANGAPDDIDSSDSRRRYLSLLPDSGWTEERLVERELQMCVSFLTANPLVDRTKITVQDPPKGGLLAAAAKKVPGVGVSGEIVPNCRIPAPHPGVDGVKKATGCRMMSEHDYVPERADGRTERTFVWAMAKLRAAYHGQRPDMLKDQEAFDRWLAMDHQYNEHKYDNTVESEFKLLKKERRPGYTLREYEFSPYEGYVVKTMILCPDDAKPGKTPVMVCVPGTAYSYQTVAGEPNPYWCPYPTRERQAWWYCKVGMIGVALENVANANNVHDDIRYYKSQAWALARLGKIRDARGPLSQEKLMTREITMCINFLKKSKLVDPTKIGVSGMSLGCIVIDAARALPDVKAICYNDFAIHNSARRLCLTRCMSNAIQGGFRGDGGLTWMALPPKYLLLNEGGAYKNHIENIEKAYEMAGCRDRLTVHYYDHFAPPIYHLHDAKDLAMMRDYDMDDFYRHNNCDPYDHSFHAESALPWICRVFWGDETRITDEVRAELTKAKAERYIDERDQFPPDAYRGRKAIGPLDREITDADLVPERPDGRTEKTCTWIKMVLDGKIEMPK